MRKEITNEGNLPKSLRVMAKDLRGVRTTFFYEYNTGEELEKVCADGLCDELSCAKDPSSERNLLVGFKVREPIVQDKSSLVAMEIHFTELTREEFNRYAKMLDRHRKQQEEEMHARRARQRPVTNN